MSIDTPAVPAAPADDVVAARLHDAAERSANAQRVYRRYLGQPACPTGRDYVRVLDQCRVGLRFDDGRLSYVVIDARRGGGYEAVHLDDTGAVCNHTARVSRSAIIDQYEHGGELGVVAYDTALDWIRNGDSRGGR